jgi:hypothetical protein
VALAGLSAFQARRHPRLVWAAFAIPAIGSIASIVGLVIAAAAGDRPLAFGLSSWDLWFGGVISMMAGSALFAAATWHVRSLSRGPTAILFAGSVAIVPAAFAMVASVPLVGELGLLVAFLAFCGGWVGIGVSALRTGRPMPVTAPAG